MSTGSSPDERQRPPAWFRGALAAAPRHGATVVDGARITYRAWGPTGRPGVVLVHGAGAHAGWWDHLGPLLADTHRVVALDLSGHGDSDRRPAYSLDRWAAEVACVAGESGIVGPAVLVGHSLGGFVTLRTAELSAPAVAGVVAVDPPVRRVRPEDLVRRARRAAAVLRRYADHGEAAARWRPSPAQAVLPYVAAHVAHTSVRRFDDGWSWKFDPRTHRRPEVELDTWSTASRPVVLVRAEHGLLSAEMADLLRRRLGPLAVTTDIAGAGHHIMLDRPLALVETVRRARDAWHRPGAVPFP
ncbi:alpha/beta fold hydrolase [Streptomyces sp. NPDC059517]|uniref:alpha/beta fold hydrolase n=1 Tax=Streptomyces sp. NPDC059517 TaxID=3346855 RepID=UPI003675EB9D